MCEGIAYLFSIKLTIFLKPSLLRMFIRHAFDQMDASMLVISVHICELDGFTDAPYRLTFMDVLSCV